MEAVRDEWARGGLSGLPDYPDYAGRDFRLRAGPPLCLYLLAAAGFSGCVFGSLLPACVGRPSNFLAALSLFFLGSLAGMFVMESELR